jgi:hypothetical protein
VSGRVGQTCADNNMLADIVDVSNDIVIPEPQHGPAILRQT